MQGLGLHQAGMVFPSCTAVSSLYLFSMKKNTEIVSGLVNEEHPFHQVQTQPGKAKKHRYERRKVRNILKIADWAEAEEYEEAS